MRATPPGSMTRSERLVEALLIILVAVPVVGVIMGGVYWLPAAKLTKERDPGLTLLLSVGSGITVFGLGSLFNAPVVYLAAAWALTLVLLLLARLAYGSLGHHVERFGVIHVAALLLVG